jgi:hypothetical protein
MTVILYQIGLISHSRFKVLSTNGIKVQSKIYLLRLTINVKKIMPTKNQGMYSPSLDPF